jgi:hypothetical protein
VSLLVEWASGFSLEEERAVYAKAKVAFEILKAALFFCGENSRVGATEMVSEEFRSR